LLFPHKIFQPKFSRQNFFHQKFSRQKFSRQKFPRQNIFKNGPASIRKMIYAEDCPTKLLWAFNSAS